MVGERETGQVYLFLLLILLLLLPASSISTLGAARKRVGDRVAYRGGERLAKDSGLLLLGLSTPREIEKKYPMVGGWGGEEEEEEKRA